MTRYPEYQETGIPWLGEIPSHWDKVRLKFVSHIEMGQSPDSSECNERGKGLPFLQGNAEFEDLHPTPKQFCPTANKVCNPEDILLSVRAPVGELNVADQAYGIGRGLCAIAPGEKLDDVFAWYLLHLTRNELNAVATGSTYDAVSVSEVEDMLCSLPPLPEQRAIAAFLDERTARLDAAAAEYRRLADLLREHRAALISHAVTQGLDPDVPCKESGIEWLGEIPAHWEVMPLKYVCRESALYGANLPATEYISDGVRFLRTTDIDDAGNLSSEDAVYVDRALVKEYILQDGDLLLSRSGTVGRSFVYRSQYGECAYAGYLVGFRLNQTSLLPQFAFYFTKTSQFLEWLNLAMISSTIGNVNGQKYANMPIASPSLPEQRAIAAYLDRETARIDAALDEIDAAIGHLAEYRAALIAAAVTGKINVQVQRTLEVRCTSD